MVLILEGLLQGLTDSQFAVDRPSEPSIKDLVRTRYLLPLVLRYVPARHCSHSHISVTSRSDCPLLLPIHFNPFCVRASLAKDGSRWLNRQKLLLQVPISFPNRCALLEPNCSVASWLAL